MESINQHAARNLELVREKKPLVHSITNFVPHENFVALINAIHRYGVY